MIFKELFEDNPKSGRIDRGIYSIVRNLYKVYAFRSIRVHTRLCRSICGEAQLYRIDLLSPCGSAADVLRGNDGTAADKGEAPDGKAEPFCK